MIRRAHSHLLLFVLLASAVLTGASPAEASHDIFGSHGILIIQVRTDYTPATEFVGVRTTAVNTDDPTWTYTRERVAYTGLAWSSGVRVAEIDEMTPGPYRMVVDLLDGDENVVSSRPVRVDVEGNKLRVVTILFTRPEADVELVGVVDEAVEFPEQICPGDMIHYTATLAGEGVQRLTIPAGTGTVLVPESILATHGDVKQAAGDGVVEVDNLNLEEGETAVVKYDAIVAPIATQQARAQVRVGNDEDFASAMILSDDPSTQEPGDATESDLSDVCRLRDDLGECQEEVDFLEFEVEKLEGTVSNLQDQLDALTGDPDGDGVIAARDECPDTAPGATVDADGCSQAQFCAAIDVSQPNGANVCRFADWLGDEPVGNPKDCHPKGGSCDPS